MGGFKRGGTQPTGRGGRFNMAMGQEGQREMQRTLLGEFELAQSRRADFQNRGTGLGFTAPTNKKFAIDAESRNSVRFDD